MTPFFVLGGVQIILLTVCWKILPSVASRFHKILLSTIIFMIKPKPSPPSLLLVWLIIANSVACLADNRQFNCMFD